MVKRCLPKLRRAFPGSYQLVYDYSNSLVVAFGMSERGYEAIVAIAVFPHQVRLYFDKSLPDPKGLLEGSGAKVRSVTLKTASDLDRADIKALHQGCDQALRGHLPEHSRDPHDHQVGVEEAETREVRTRLTGRSGRIPRRGRDNMMCTAAAARLCVRRLNTNHWALL
jgi:hypothetical protein